MYSLADPRGRTRDAPLGPISNRFHVVFGGNFGQIIGWRVPALELAPRLGNPGSATGASNDVTCHHFYSYMDLSVFHTGDHIA